MRSVDPCPHANAQAFLPGSREPGDSINTPVTDRKRRTSTRCRLDRCTLFLTGETA
jgi:hypothetical protein